MLRFMVRSCSWYGKVPFWWSEFVFCQLHAGYDDLKPPTMRVVNPSNGLNLATWGVQVQRRIWESFSKNKSMASSSRHLWCWEASGSHYRFPNRIDNWHRLLEDGKAFQIQRSTGAKGEHPTSFQNETGQRRRLLNVKPISHGQRSSSSLNLHQARVVPSSQ